MFTWFKNLSPFMQNLISRIVTSIITAGLLALAAAGIYRPATVNVQAPTVRVSLDGSLLNTTTAPATAPK